MPNNVTTEIRITGPLQDRAMLEAFIKGKESAFDFNKLRPMPPELRSVTTGGCNIDGKSYTVWRVKKGKDGEEINEPIPQATLTIGHIHIGEPNGTLTMCS